MSSQRRVHGAGRLALGRDRRSRRPAIPSRRSGLAVRLVAPEVDRVRQIVHRENLDRDAARREVADVDGFKNVNDQWGHAQTVGRRRGRLMATVAIAMAATMLGGTMGRGGRVAIPTLAQEGSEGLLTQRDRERIAELASSARQQLALVRAHIAESRRDLRRCDL